MAYTFARVSAACRLTAADYIDLGRRVFIRLNEKGGAQREIPCHRQLAEYLDAGLKAGVGNLRLYVGRKVGEFVGHASTMGLSL